MGAHSDLPVYPCTRPSPDNESSALFRASCYFLFHPRQIPITRLGIKDGNEPHLMYLMNYYYEFDTLHA